MEGASLVQPHCNHTLNIQCALEMENETEVEKLEVQYPIMMSLADPVHTESDLTLFSYSASFS